MHAWTEPRLLLDSLHFQLGDSVLLEIKVYVDFIETSVASSFRLLLLHCESVVLDVVPQQVRRKFEFYLIFWWTCFIAFTVELASHIV